VGVKGHALGKNPEKNRPGFGHNYEGALFLADLPAAALAVGARVASIGRNHDVFGAIVALVV